MANKYPTEVSNTEKAMRTASASLRESFSNEPVEIRQCMTNALLNIAISRLIEDEGKRNAAAILWRLVDHIQFNSTPTVNNPADLSAMH
tara:strand:- start:179 stop:445 length:267 start_codon:yes stop_codon:yes gene_type:complete